MYTAGNKCPSKNILGEEIKKIRIMLAGIYDTTLEK